MIINKTENTVVSISNDKHMKFGIDDGNFSLVYKSFLNYSNPIGSIVREITSNCFDSHIEAGIDKPVKIIWRDEDRLSGTPSSISFIDEGIGMSEERVENVYCKFFTSTKRETNSQIGGFGIGAKTPLSYVDMFSVITVSDGIEYHYSVHKGSSSPEMSLLSKIKTDKLNGTEIRINVKVSDKPLFFNEIEKQLKYFDNVQVENFGMYGYQKKIYHGKSFVFSEMDNKNRHDEMDLCIGKVRYPLDKFIFNNMTYIQRSSLAMPIGLRFEIGEISVTWNRESVEYTEDTKNKILSRLNTVIAEVHEIFKEQSKPPLSVAELIAAPTFMEITIGNTSIPLNFLNTEHKTPFLKIKDFSFEKGDASSIINEYIMTRDPISKIPGKYNNKRNISFSSYAKGMALCGYLFDNNQKLNEKAKWILSKRSHPLTSWKHRDLTIEFQYPYEFDTTLSKNLLHNKDKSTEIKKKAKEAFDEFVKQVIEFVDKEIERLISQKQLIRIKDVVFSKQEEDLFIAHKMRKKKVVNDQMRIEYNVDNYYKSIINKPSAVFELAKQRNVKIMIIDINENRKIADNIRLLLKSQLMPSSYMCVAKSRIQNVLKENNLGISIMTCEQFSKSKLLMRIKQRIRDYKEVNIWHNLSVKLLKTEPFYKFPLKGHQSANNLLDFGDDLEASPEIKEFYEKMIGEDIIKIRKNFLNNWNTERLDYFFGKTSNERKMIDELEVKIKQLPTYNPKYEYKRLLARISTMDTAKIGDDSQ